MGTCYSASLVMTFRAPPRFILCVQWHRLLSAQANAPFVPCGSASVCDYQWRIKDMSEGKMVSTRKEIIISKLSNSVWVGTSTLSRISGLREATWRTHSPEVGIVPQMQCWVHLRPDRSAGTHLKLIPVVWTCNGFTAFYCFSFLLWVCFVCLFNISHMLWSVLVAKWKG